MSLDRLLIKERLSIFAPWPRLSTLRPLGYISESPFGIRLLARTEIRTYNYPPGRQSFVGVPQ